MRTARRASGRDVIGVGGRLSEMEWGELGRLVQAEVLKSMAGDFAGMGVAVSVEGIAGEVEREDG